MTQPEALRAAVGQWPGDETDEEIREALKDAPQREPWPSPEQVTAALDDAGTDGHDEPDGEALENVGRQVARKVAAEADDEDGPAPGEVFRPPLLLPEQSGGTLDRVIRDNAEADKKSRDATPARTPRKSRKGRKGS